MRITASLVVAVLVLVLGVCFATEFPPDARGYRFRGSAPFVVEAQITADKGFDSSQYFENMQDFVMTSITGASYEQIHGVILNADTNDFAISSTPDGIIAVTLAASDNDTSQLVLSLPVTASKGSLVFEARVAAGTSIEDMCICMGFTDVSTLELPASVSGTTITTTASNAVVFVYDTDATVDRWYGVGVAADTDATGNGITASAPVADTFAVYRIEISADGATAKFFINGSEVKRLTASSVTASTSLYATIVIENRDADGASNLKVDYIKAGHNR